MTYLAVHALSYVRACAYYVYIRLFPVHNLTCCCPLLLGPLLQHVEVIQRALAQALQQLVAARHGVVGQHGRGDAEHAAQTRGGVEQTDHL